MNMVERAKEVMIGTGSEWVLWVLAALSVASIAIILERVLKLRALSGDIGALRKPLIQALHDGGFAKAREVMAGYRHPAAKVVLRGMAQDEKSTTAKQAEEAMSAETIAQQRNLQQRFSFLATLGANAPFIGLFGTVVGILQAFEALGSTPVAQAAASVAPQAVMASIAEALVATAVGLGVAIPAVFAFNMFQRTVKGAMDDARILSLEVLSYLHAPPERDSLATQRVLPRAPRDLSTTGSRSPLTLDCPA